MFGYRDNRMIKHHYGHLASFNRRRPSRRVPAVGDALVALFADHDRKLNFVGVLAMKNLS